MEEQEGGGVEIVGGNVEGGGEGGRGGGEFTENVVGKGLRKRSRWPESISMAQAPSRF